MDLQAFLDFLFNVLGIANSFVHDELVLDGLRDNFMNPMFQHVMAKNPGKSVIFSAYSVVTPLYEIALACVGPSHEELIKALGVPDNDNSINVITNLTQRILSVRGVTLDMANKIYIAQDEKINKKFAEMTQEKFNTYIQNIDFSNTQRSADEINDWVAYKTNHKITNLVEPRALQGARSVLVNALYFKGSWEKKFNIGKTSIKTFHVTRTQKVMVPTMSMTEDFMYGESTELDAKLLELPYEGGEVSFLIVLPNQINGLTHLQRKLRNNALLRNAVKNMKVRKVVLSMPKFKIETEINLREILTKVKITKIFNPREAKLNHMLENESNSLYIGAAIQKAFIEVNEDGAEAAAANAFTIKQLSTFIPDTRSFNADHPFVFHIKEKDNILFSGVYQS